MGCVRVVRSFCFQFFYDQHTVCAVFVQMYIAYIWMYILLRNGQTFGLGRVCFFNKNEIDKLARSSPVDKALYKLMVTWFIQFCCPKSRRYSISGWLGSRVVSVLDSGAEGPGFKSQSRRCRITVLGKLLTSIVPLFTSSKIGSSPLKGCVGNCRPGGKYWQSTAGFMTHVSCRLTAKNRDQLRNLTLGNRVWATFTFYLQYMNLLSVSMCVGLPGNVKACSQHIT